MQWTARFSEKGKLLWERTEGIHPGNRGLSIIETKEGGVLIGGYRSFLTRHKDRHQNPVYSRRASITSYGPGGKKNWEQEFGGGVRDGVVSIFQQDEDSFLIVGTINSHLAVLNMDSSGKRYFSREVIEDFYQESLDAAARLDQGTIAVVSTQKNPETGFRRKKLVFLGFNGEIKNEVPFPQTLDFEVKSIGQTDQSALLLAGYEGQPMSRSRARLFRFTQKSGFTDLFHGRIGSGFHSMSFLLSNQIILSGFKTMGGNQGQEAWILGLNSNFQKEFERVYGSFGPDIFYGMQNCWDGGLIFSGQSNFSTGTGTVGPHGWILRTDRLGRSVEKSHYDFISDARSMWKPLALREFLTTYPDSPHFQAGKNYLQEMMFFERARDSEHLEDLVRFAIRFPKSRLRNSVLDMIMKRIVKRGEILALLGFVLQFADSVQACQAFDKLTEIVWDRISSSNSMDEFQFFLRSYPLSVRFSQAFEKLEQLEYSQMLKQVQTNKRSIGEIAFRKVEQGSIALKKNDFDEAFRKLSLVLESEPFLKAPISSNPLRIEEFQKARERFYILDQRRAETRKLWQKLQDSHGVSQLEFGKNQEREALLFWQVEKMLKTWKRTEFLAKIGKKSQKTLVEKTGLLKTCSKDLQSLCNPAILKLKEIMPGG